ncbi:hypothetical protein LIER_25898 [Lithospermum erythrorhizon]|uniref:Uncharacterized protein n=1 Tax=Lithospermum erythrorhizon TaxID=34254 RepID=A0AAV3R9V9_LITER
MNMAYQKKWPLYLSTTLLAVLSGCNVEYKPQKQKVAERQTKLSLLRDCVFWASRVFVVHLGLNGSEPGLLGAICAEICQSGWHLLNLSRWIGDTYCVLKILFLSINVL